jgi:hypothetical protein
LRSSFLRFYALAREARTPEEKELLRLRLHMNFYLEFESRNDSALLHLIHFALAFPSQAPDARSYQYASDFFKALLSAYQKCSGMRDDYYLDEYDDWEKKPRIVSQNQRSEPTLTLPSVPRELPAAVAIPKELSLPRLEENEIQPLQLGSLADQWFDASHPDNAPTLLPDAAPLVPEEHKDHASAIRTQLDAWEKEMAAGVERRKVRIRYKSSGHLPSGAIVDPLIEKQKNRVEEATNNVLQLVRKEAPEASRQRYEQSLLGAQAVAYPDLDELIDLL